MNNERKIYDLQHESLKKHPFGVPEGYFESFSERLQERIIREDAASKVPVRRIVPTTRLRVAIAAAVLGVALISYSIIRFTAPNIGAEGSYFDIALLEQLQVIDDDSYLMELMDNGTEVLNEDEAFASQAIEYLAINDVEMDLIFE
ncbi:MAG: hypothetical protein ABFS38_04090 [Bacteroidota bacterium]